MFICQGVNNHPIANKLDTLSIKVGTHTQIRTEVRLYVHSTPVHDSCPIHSKYSVYKSTTTDKSVTMMRRVHYSNRLQ